MADSSVLLEVIVEGKNIKLVQRDIEELGASINKSADATDKDTKQKKKNKKATQDLNDENKNYNRGQKGVAQATANGTKAFSKQRDLIGSGSSGLVGAYATLAANLFAATAAFGALRRASQVEQLTQGLEALGAASGIALGSLSENLRSATGNAISLEQAMRSTVQITSAGLDPSSVERFGEVARNVSIALGRDLTDSLDRLTRGVTKLEPELLDELGIFVRVDEATEEYARSIGKTAGELTNFERRLAFQNATLEQAEEKYKAIGEAVDVSPYEKLAASLANLSDSTLRVVNVALEPLVEVLSKSPTLLLAAIGLLGGSVIKQAVGSLITFNVATEKNIKSQRDLSREISRQLPQYTKSSKKLIAVTQALKTGVVSNKALTDAIKEQETTIRRSITSFTNQKISAEANEATILRSTEAIKLLSTAQANNARATAKNSAALVIAEIQQGNYKRALKRTVIMFGRYNKAAKLTRTTTAGLNTVWQVGKLRVLQFAQGLKILGAAFLSAIPIIGQAIAVLTILYDIITSVVDTFKGDDQKQFEEQSSSLAETVKELSNSFVEIDAALTGQSSTVSSTSLAYENLSKSIDQFFGEYRKLGEAENFSDRLKILTDFASKSKVLNEVAENALKIADEQNLSAKERVALVEEAIMKEKIQADAIRSVGQSTKGVSEALANLRQDTDLRSPFTEASNALSSLVIDIDAVSKSTDNFGSSILENLSQEDADYLGLGDARIRLEETKTALEGIQAKLQELNEEVQTTRPWYYRLLDQGARDEIDKEIADAAKIFEDRKKALEVQAQTLSDQAKEEGASLTENIRLRSKTLKQVDEVLKTSQFIEKGLKAQLAAEKAKGSFAQESIRKQISLENELANQQITRIDATIDERELQKAGIEAARKRNELAAAQTEDEEEKKNLAKENAQLDLEILALKAEISQLTGQRKEAEQAISTEIETQLRLAQANLKTVQMGQKSQLAVLAITQKIAANQKSAANDQLAINRSNLETARAISGQSVTAEDQLQIAQQAQKATEEAAKAELAVKIQQIELEYALIEARLAVTRAELLAARERGDIDDKTFSAAANAINPFLEGGDRLLQAQQSALRAAGMAYARTVTEASNATIRAQAAVTAERFSNSAAFYDALAQNARAVGNEQKAIELEKISLAIQRAAVEQLIGKAAAQSLSDEELKLELARLRTAEIEKQNELTSIDTAQAERLGGPIAGQTAQVIQNIQLDAAGGENSILNSDELADKIFFIQQQMQGFTDQLAKLGPDGELIASVVQGAFITAEAWANVGDTFARTTNGLERGASVAMAVAATFSAIGQVLSAQSNARIAAIDAEIAAEKKRDGKSKESQAKIAQLEKKKEAQQRKQFEMQKKIQMATIVASTAAAVMQTLAASGVGFFATPLAMLVAAMGAAQLAIVAGTSFQGGGSSSVGEAGMPSSISMGDRTGTVDLSRSQSAGGELAYFRGEQGTGGPENFTPAFMGAEYRAMGGPTAGYVVGEQGPELFVPDTPGTIVPNSDVALTAPAQNVNFTINAVDARGVESLLMEQRGNIIGMLRESANSYGDAFFEDVEVGVYTPSALGASKA